MLGETSRKWHQCHPHVVSSGSLRIAGGSVNGIVDWPQLEVGLSTHRSIAARSKSIQAQGSRSTAMAWEWPWLQLLRLHCEVVNREVAYTGMLSGQYGNLSRSQHETPRSELSGVQISRLLTFCNFNAYCQQSLLL